MTAKPNAVKIDGERKPTTFAYIRVSTDNKGQTTENQRIALEATGFRIDEFVSEDGVSGSKPAFERPAFAGMAKRMVEGDTLFVVAVDRLGRTASDVLNTVEALQNRGIKIRVLQFDSMDITSPTGKMILTCMSAMAELERNLLIERTKAGLKRTQSEGTRLGAPLTIKPEVLRNMSNLRAVKSLTELQIQFGYPRATIDRVLKKWGGNLDGYQAEFETQQAQYAQKEA